MRSRLVLVLLALLAPLLAVLPSSGSSSAAPQGRLTIEVLSNRSDLVSGGDVLVAVDLPRAVKPGRVRVKLGGRDVTQRFSTSDGRLVGLVTGLEVGRNVLRATAPKARAARAVVINHPNGGPLFSGPQAKHYVCQDTATDAQCNEPATYDYLYKSTNPATPATPPSWSASAPLAPSFRMRGPVSLPRAERSSAPTTASTWCGPASASTAADRARSPTRASGRWRTSTPWSVVVVATSAGGSAGS